MQLDPSYFLYFTSLIWFGSLAYLLLAIFSVIRFNKHRQQTMSETEFTPPVTILKPIYGLDPEMAENLRSFCKQDYPNYQIVFGIQDENDPAIFTVKKIIREFKDLDISYIIDPTLYGTNHKISNLINTYPCAKHDYLLIADSDMRVSNDYLKTIMTAFADDKVGAVTCLYSGSARGKIASSLNAMFINEWFLPSVLISKLLKPINYCLGATMVVRKDLLEKIGGFKALSNHLADDYMLGNLISDLGYKIHLSNYIVENIVEEASIKDLFLHELRWARTLRRVEPMGYAFTFFTDTFVISGLLAVIGYITTQNMLLSLLPLLVTLLARGVLHLYCKQTTGSEKAGSLWLIPIRDALSFIIRIISFTGNSVQWRSNSFNVDAAGLIHSDTETITDINTDIEKTPELVTTKIVN